MRLTCPLLALAAAALAGCGAKDDSRYNKSAETVANSDSGQAAPAASASAALALVENYAGAMAKGDREAASALWSDPRAAAQFAATLEDYPTVAITPGTPSPASAANAAGAATPVQVPLALTLTLRNGSPYQMSCTATVAAADSGAQQIRSIDC